MTDEIRRTIDGVRWHPHSYVAQEGRVRVEFLDEGYYARVTEFKEGRDGTLTARVAIHAITTPEPIIDARVRVTDIAARQKIAEQLITRVPVMEGADGRSYWPEMVETICSRAMSGWDEMRSEGATRAQMVGSIARRHPSPSLLTGFGNGDGITLFWADGSTGKSVFLMGVGISLASGREVIPGLVPARAMKVGWVSFEGRERQDLDRLDRICLAHDIDVAENLAYWEASGQMDDTAVVSEMTRMRDELGVEVFLIDSASYAVQGADGLVGADGPQRFKAACVRLARPVIAIAHTASQVIKVDPEKPYGSVFWRNSCWEGWSGVKRGREEGEDAAPLITVEAHVIDMVCQKNNDGPDGQGMSFLIDWNAEVLDDNLDPVPGGGIRFEATSRDGKAASTVKKRVGRPKAYPDLREKICNATGDIGKEYTRKEVFISLMGQYKAEGREAPSTETLRRELMAMEGEGIITTGRQSITRTKTPTGYESIIGEGGSEAEEDNA